MTTTGDTDGTTGAQHVYYSSYTTTIRATHATRRPDSPHSPVKTPFSSSHLPFFAATGAGWLFFPAAVLKM